MAKCTFADGCKYSIVRKTHATFHFKNACIVTVNVISSHMFIFKIKRLEEKCVVV